MKAVIFKSQRRFEAFKRELINFNVDVVVLDFLDENWITFDYSDIDIVIYFPQFNFESNHPNALHEVHDNIIYLHKQYPSLRIFPDPNVIWYYSDKYRQNLFLNGSGLPYAATFSACDLSQIEQIELKLGYPLILKNRYGAGGNFVFKISNRREFEKYLRISLMDFWRFSSIKWLLQRCLNREYLFSLIKAHRAEFPFLSSPLLAQQWVPHDSDIKTVVFEGTVVEAHWRRKADPEMWKMNIDGGGIGEWSHVPTAVIDISEHLAKKLNARWLNIDLIKSGDNYLISEFSPVWHHYSYGEKESFVYKDDYNIPLPLKTSLNLEYIIVHSLVHPGRPIEPLGDN